MSDRPLCLHCKRNLAVRSRGLCGSCFEDLDIRAKYPRRCRRVHDNEPSMEELEALIARQLQRLPRWWAREERRISPFRGGFTPRFTAQVRATERKAT